MRDIPGDSHLHMRDLPWGYVRYSWVQNIWGTFCMTIVKFEDHNLVTFSPTGLEHFYIHFDFLEPHLFPLLRGKLIILFRSGNSFVKVPIKTCWPGSHFDPVWWPYITPSCSIRWQSYNLTLRRLAFVPPFLRQRQCFPLPSYRKKWKSSQTGSSEPRKECGGYPGVPVHPINPAPRFLVGGLHESLLPWPQCRTLASTRTHCNFFAELGNMPQTPFENKRYE